MHGCELRYPACEARSLQTSNPAHAIERQERRIELTKIAGKYAESAKVAVRNIRRDGNDLIKKSAKDKKISEDEEKRSLEEIQKLTDDEIRRMEEMCRNKEREVLQI